MKWHTKQERNIIRKYGGIPLVKYGYDGTIKGKPVEVRAVRKDKRFRIQKDVHNVLVKRNGSYIFISKGRSRKISAKKVSKKLSRGKWFKDRRYPHKFLKVKQVF